MDSVVQRGNFWFAQMKLDGKTRQKTTGIPVAGDAEHSPADRRQTVLLFVEEWERSVKEQLSPSVTALCFAGAVGAHDVCVVPIEEGTDGRPVPLLRVWFDVFADSRRDQVAFSTLSADLLAMRLFEGAHRRCDGCFRTKGSVGFVTGE